MFTFKSLIVPVCIYVSCSLFVCELVDIHYSHCNYCSLKSIENVQFVQCFMCGTLIKSKNVSMFVFINSIIFWKFVI